MFNDFSNTRDENTYFSKFNVPNNIYKIESPALPAIWQYDRKQRPAFTSICTTLEEISQTEFVNLGDSDFSTLRLEWQDELDMIYRDIQEKEDKLYQREEEVRVWGLTLAQ